MSGDFDDFGDCWLLGLPWFTTLFREEVAKWCVPPMAGLGNKFLLPGYQRATSTQGGKASGEGRRWRIEDLHMVYRGKWHVFFFPKTIWKMPAKTTIGHQDILLLWKDSDPALMCKPRVYAKKNIQIFGNIISVAHPMLWVRWVPNLDPCLDKSEESWVWMSTPDSQPPRLFHDVSCTILIFSWHWHSTNGSVSKPIVPL